MLSSSDPVGVKAKWVGRVGDLLHGASITAKWGKYGEVSPGSPSVEFAGDSRRWVRRRTKVLQVHTNKEDSVESPDPKGKKKRRKKWPRNQLGKVTDFDGPALR
jgi:hypothetical protein